MSSDLASQLLDVADSGFVVVNTDQRVVVWNSWMERASAIPRGKALGATLSTLFATALTLHDTIAERPRIRSFERFYLANGVVQ